MKKLRVIFVALSLFVMVTILSGCTITANDIILDIVNDISIAVGVN